MFDTLVETKRERQTKRALATFPIALGAHIILLSVLIVWNIYAVDELEAPILMVSIFQAEAPPPPPPRRRRRPGRPPRR